MNINQPLPTHIAIILDGNRRWAKLNKLKIIRGHEKVVKEIIERLVDHCLQINQALAKKSKAPNNTSQGIKYLTFWAFSTENWQRDPQEVRGIMKLFRDALNDSSQRLHEKGVRLNSIGDLSRFEADIRNHLEKWKKISQNNQQITVTFALNYGGRDEIIRAMKKMISQNNTQELIKNLDDSTFTQFLDTAGMPEPDLIIRPGGERRLSGFMPWQSVYSELYFTSVLMPDFDEAELDQALTDFQQRQRRFGK